MFVAVIGSAECDRDVEALADAILTLLTDTPRREQMGRLARESVRRRYDAATLTRKWEELLISGIEKRANV
mgnify:CR=1 FL=1